MPWADRAWDPTRGCTKISAGCDHCMARQSAERWWWFDTPTVCEEELLLPFDEKRGCHILTSSLGDLFHRDIPMEYVFRVLDVMYATPRHTYYLLTKRAQRMAEYLKEYPLWPLPNVNIGVSVENQRCLQLRVPHLVDIPVRESAYRYLSCEPLLGPLKFSDYVHELGWVTATKERGNGARYMDPVWMDSLKLQFYRAGVPVYHHRSKDPNELLQPHRMGSEWRWRRKVAAAQHGILV